MFAFSFVCAHRAQLFTPMTALAMVIFNHILSRISRPESGNCITLTMVAMSVLLADRGRSSNSGAGEEFVSGTSQLLKCCEVVIIKTELMFLVCDGDVGWLSLP